MSINMDESYESFELRSSKELLNYLYQNDYSNWNRYFAALAYLVDSEMREPSNFKSDLISRIQKLKPRSHSHIKWAMDHLQYNNSDCYETLSSPTLECTHIPPIRDEIQRIIFHLHDEFSFLSELRGDIIVHGFHFPFDVELNNLRHMQNLKFTACYFHGKFVVEKCSFSSLQLDFVYKLNFKLSSAQIHKVSIGSEFRSRLYISIDRMVSLEQLRVRTRKTIGGTFSLSSVTECSAMDLELGVVGSINFVDSDLSNLVLSNTKLRIDATPISSAFENITFSERTKFKNCNLNEMKADRFALECLQAYGGLSAANRASMNIVDDAATLRMSYSGLNKWIHLAAFLSFIFPYAAFLYVRILESRFSLTEQTETITLLSALMNYIKTGGTDWQYGAEFHLSLATFAVAFLYNILRVVLLRKTKILEEQETISNLPSNFSFSERILTLYGGNLWGRRKDNINVEITWNTIFKASKVLFWIYLAAVLLNSFHFLTRQVPI